MKVINNQWQLSSAICLLIITWLTLPPFNSPETGLGRPAASLFPAPVFELRSVSMSTTVCTIYLCVCVFTDITHRICVQRNTAAALFFLIYIYIASTFTVWTIKPLFHANREKNSSIFIWHSGGFITNVTAARKAVCSKRFISESEVLLLQYSIYSRRITLKMDKH